MKIPYSLGICLIALSGCADAGAAKAPPQILADETATISSIVVRASNFAHPDCQASSAVRKSVLEPGVHNSMEQWAVTCNGVEHLYQVLIARLGGGVMADVLEGDPIMLQPTAAECTMLRDMLERAEASTEEPSADLIGAYQQVMYKTLACQ